MELKNYQKKVMKDLDSYMAFLEEATGIKKAWSNYWLRQDICVGMGGVPSYVDTITGVPHVCMKIPTGGGKTFMACAAIKNIFANMPQSKPKVVVWLVPSDPILNQTTKTLSNPEHDYRKRLDSDFGGRVGVYTKDMLLSGQNFSPDTIREMMTIAIMSYGSLRIDSRKKDVRKVYQENGNLFKFADYFNNKDILLADTPDTALIQVLRQLEPVVVVDESHNASSDLSIEMLKRLNPSFILELTATPKQNSNIISYVDARELKKENMVKLPVIAYFRNDRQSVILDAIQFRGYLEKQAIEEERSGGEYIRPIVLFQAQPNSSEDSETFIKVKNLLLSIGIPEEQIGIKTSNVDDISKLDLLSRDCEIRYIITVNALKEGWDCPFAYILASIANKSSRVDVEQILGRVLRQPYAKRHRGSLLNSSYVFTCSNNFHETIDNILLGLNNAGFSEKDYRVGNVEEINMESDGSEEPANPMYGIQMTTDDFASDITSSDNQESANGDNFDDIDTSSISINITNEQDKTGADISIMAREAEKSTAEYEEDFNDAETNMSGFFSGEQGAMLNQYGIQEKFKDEVKNMKIPQFCIETVPDLFGEKYEPLETEALSEGFLLAEQNAEVNFEIDASNIYKFDIEEEGDAVPKYKKVKQNSAEYIKDIIFRFPEEKQLNVCIESICTQLNKNNRLASDHIKKYVNRVLGNLDNDSVTAMMSNVPSYARKINDKISLLEDDYREITFSKWLDSGKIVCKPYYTLSGVITPAQAINSIPNSLYVSEKNDMNDFEREVVDVIASLDNIKWWHRIIEHKDFRLNGFINHYPDFMVMTKKDTLILVEVKGDHLANDDSKKKLKLGRLWQSYAGSGYRYFMVFKDTVIGEGSYKLDDFVEVVKNL